MASIPQHQKLSALLREQIQNGVFHEGDLLPSENELCTLHNLTRPTVRQALSALVNEGFVKKHQGKGSIVTLPSKEVGILSIQGTTSAIGQENLITRIISKPIVKKWEQPFFYDLSDAELKAGCIEFERIRLVNGVPIFFDITYMPNINLPRFTSRQFENRSLFDILRKNYLINVIGGKQRIRAIPANEQLSKHLNVEVGKPVLHLERKIETSRKNYAFYSVLYCNTDSFSLFGTF